GERRRLTAHAGEVRALAFAPDGKRLASGGADPSVLVWDVSGSGGTGATGQAAPTAAGLDALWARLAGGRAAPAYRGMGVLAAYPDRSLPFLKRRLRTGEKADAAIRRLVEQLDDEQFGVREKATRELAERGEEAEPALRRALADQPPADL